MSDMGNRKMPTAIPTARQLEFQDWEFGLFLHFGLRTFHEGHRDFDGKPMDPARFNPTELDCEQWTATAKAAGMRYAILTAKHHDGFANWPSRYTDYSVASSPWQGGKGDVVREFADACRRQDMKIGLYYSPVDVSCPVYEDPRAYDDYFINQLSELLTGYGEIDILWFDSCGSERHTYDWDRITKEIRSMQPCILLFSMGDPDYRWVGNEEGIAPPRRWNTIAAEEYMKLEQLARPMRSSTLWLPSECNFRMRLANWFYSDQDEDTVKSLEELIGLYYYSVGRGCNLLLNFGPDRRGLLPDKDGARLLEFGAEIQRRFAHPIVSLADWQRVDDGWEVLLEKRALIDHLIVQEELTNGEHIQRFELQVAPKEPTELLTVYEGDNIGHKAICQFPPVMACQLKLRILKSDGPAMLRRLDTYFVAGQQ